MNRGLAVVFEPGKDAARELFKRADIDAGIKGGEQ